MLLTRGWAFLGQEEGVGKKGEAKLRHKILLGK